MWCKKEGKQRKNAIATNINVGEIGYNTPDKAVVKAMAPQLEIPLYKPL